MKILAAAVLLVLASAVLRAQDRSVQDIPDSSLISRSTTAIGFTVGGGSTKVDLIGTELMPGAAGEAKVQAKAKAGLTNIEVTVRDMASPSKLGAEYLTYVLWVVTPDGRSGNSGEIFINNEGEGKLTTTTPAQTFSMIITAEPYFVVRVPSERIVLTMETRKNTKGKLFPVTDYKLMKQGQYAKMDNPLAMTPDLSKVPLEVYEARNAVDIAKSRGSDKYAPEIFSKAQASLQSSETLLAGKADKKQIVSSARQTVQFAEDARALSAQRQEEQRITAEREAAAAKAKAEAESKAAAEAAVAKARADEEARRQSELSSAKEAQMKAEADAAALKAKMAADEAARKAKMEADELAAKERAAKEETERVRKAAADLRARLLEQFNRVLPTIDTERGLQVNMGDVLFDTGKYNLRIEAREGLSKLTGIVLSHPGLSLAIEGYTDNVGSESFNQTLSEQRASTVAQYLIQQGLDAGSVTSKGFGMNMPVSPNDTAKGRQQNRRVEIIISGEVIGTKIGSTSTPQ
jgi:outer membrane protein OmpA-like peptidoglycan-associated protein